VENIAEILARSRKNSIKSISYDIGPSNEGGNGGAGRGIPLGVYIVVVVIKNHTRYS